MRFAFPTMSLDNVVDAILNDNGQDFVDDYHSSDGKHVPSDCDLCVLADHRIFYL